MLLFGTTLSLNFTDLPPYTVIWPIRLFGTREYHFNINFYGIPSCEINNKSFKAVRSEKKIA